MNKHREEEGKRFLESIGFDFEDDFWMEDYCSEIKYKELIDYMFQFAQSKLEQAEKEKKELVDMNDKDYKELQSEIVKTIRKLQQLETGIKELKEEMNLLELQLNAKRYSNK